LVISDVDAEGDLETGAEMSPKNGRLAAKLIPGSQLAELSGGAMLPRRHWYARSQASLDEIGRFVGRIRTQEASFDRALATVLFTDIVGSTEKAAEVGDRVWRDLVRRHHSIVERCWPATAEKRSIPRGMGSSRRSTGRLEPCTAPWRSSRL
jgi:hypothetical protein